ncbi:MAG: NADPH-dependent FMN reductase [bacterium]
MRGARSENPDGKGGMAERNVVFLCGGYTPSSRTHVTLQAVAEPLEEAGVSIRFVCLDELPLPLLDPSRPFHPDSDRLKEWVTEADAVAVGSPEYHGAMSGSVKNLLDYLSKEELSGKPAGLVATSGGVKGGTNTLNMLRLIFRAFHAHALPQQVAVSEEDFDEIGDLADPRARAYAHRLGKAILEAIS